MECKRIEGESRRQACVRIELLEGAVARAHRGTARGLTFGLAALRFSFA